MVAAAQLLGIGRVVWASSETTLGLPFDAPPRYAPIDEDHYPLPDGTYALSKVVGETMAVHFTEWTGGTSIALRLSNVQRRRGLRRRPGLPVRLRAAPLEPLGLRGCPTSRSPASGPCWLT